MKLVIWVLILASVFFLFLIGMNYKTEFSDIPYPATLQDVKYQPCTFTIKHSSNNPKSKNYGVYVTDSLPLYDVGALSEKECKCVEDALEFHAKGIQQFMYVDSPYFMVEVKNNQFGINIETKDTIGTKILNFNDIVRKNKDNLCQKWSY